MPNGETEKRGVSREGTIGSGRSANGAVPGAQKRIAARRSTGPRLAGT